MDDRNNRERDYRARYGTESREQRAAWREDEPRQDRYRPRDDRAAQDDGYRRRESGSLWDGDYGHGNDPRARQTSSHGSGYTGGYGASAQAGDYFGPGDFGSGNRAYSSNWDRGYGYGYGESRNPYAGERTPGPYGGGGYGGGSHQSTQRDSRNWGDRQMGGYEPGEGYARPGQERSFIERATDEVMSWWGDEDAARRREQDHAGKGPSDYTRSDERIREDANDRLTDDWRVDARGISVSVTDGEVVLGGQVPTRQEKHRAEECVERISGVRHVQNNLRVMPNQRGDSGTMGGGGSGRSTGLGETALPSGQSGIPRAGDEYGYHSEIQSSKSTDGAARTGESSTEESTDRI